MIQTPLYTEINIIDNYAETAKVTVTVKIKKKARWFRIAGLGLKYIIMHGVLYGCQ